MDETPEFRELQRRHLSEVFGVDQVPGVLAVPEGRSQEYEIRDQVCGKTWTLFQQLIKNGEVVDTNHPEAAARHRRFVSAARGDVLILGLGLGVSLQQVLQKPNVEHVTVVESPRALIDLVAPAFVGNERVQFVARSFEGYSPPSGSFFDVAYFDLWRSREQFLSRQDQVNILKERFGEFCKRVVLPFSGRGGVRMGAGRPATTNGKTKPREERKGETLVVRFSAAERELIERAARSYGVDMSALVRRGALTEARKLLEQKNVNP